MSIALCQTAMFMMLGMIEGPYPKPQGYTYDSLIAAWHATDNGWDALVCELAEYAVISEAELARRADQEFPGVYDYAVSECFGAWFGAYLLEHCDAPPLAEGRAELVRLIDEFFAQNDEYPLGVLPVTPETEEEEEL